MRGAQPGKDTGRRGVRRWGARLLERVRHASAVCLAAHAVEIVAIPRSRGEYVLYGKEAMATGQGEKRIDFKIKAC